MPKVLFETVGTLYPRLDQSHYQVAHAMLSKTIEDNPQWRDKHWSLGVETDLHSPMTKNAKITIKVTEPHPDFWLSPGLAMTFLALITIIVVALFSD